MLSKVTSGGSLGAVGRTLAGMSSRAAAVAAVFAAAGLAPAAPITPGNLVVVRIGTGSAALSSVAQAVFLDEYTTAGALVQSIALPTTTLGAQRRFTLSGSSSTEGFLNQSVDGNYLLLAGYDAAPGATNPSSSTATSVPRVIARIDLNGNIDTSTALTDSSSSNAVRSAESFDGSGAWIAGAAGGVRYAILGATTSQQLSTSVTNVRNLRIFNGQLHVSSGGAGFVGVNTVGTGLPTGSGQTTLLLPSLVGTLPNDYYFADASTIYLADDSTGTVGGLQKWVFGGSMWSKVATFDPSAAPSSTPNKALRGVTGYLNGMSQPVLFVTGDAVAAGQNKVLTVTDDGVATTFAAPLITPATNTMVRGIRYVQAPSTPSGCAGAAIGAHPASVLICPGATATFTVSASGIGLSYQWQQDTGSGFTNVTTGTGGQTASYTTAASATHGTNYRCLVISPCGIATSNSAMLTLTAPPAAPTGTAAYSTTVGVPVNMTVTVPAGATADWSAGACGGSTASPGIAGTTTHTFTPIVGGTFTFNVQARDTTLGCKSTGCLTVTVTVPVDNDTCATAIQLALHTPRAGSTVGAATDYNFTGALAQFNVAGRFGNTGLPAPGRDVVYSFVAPSSGTYSFRVTGYSTSQNLILWGTTTCPAAATPNVDVFLAANRGSAVSAEELYSFPLTAGQLVYLVVDDSGSANAGSAFVIEAFRCNQESDAASANNTTAGANPYALGDAGMQGSGVTSSDIDYFSIGTPPAGSRIFAMVDSLGGPAPDMTLRVTTAVDTIEYDDDDGDTAFGGTNPNISGAVANGAPTFLRVTPLSTATEPYRLFAVVQPPSADATAETEPNDGVATANSNAGNYFTGSVGSAGDADFFTLNATAGQLVFVSLDCFAAHTGSGTAFDGALTLQDSTGAPLQSVNGTGTTTVTAGSGTGSLSATSPLFPSEGLVWRARYTGSYHVRVGANSATGLPGAYVLSIATSPAPVTGVCCSGSSCTVATDLACQASLGEFTAGGSCLPNPCVGGACCRVGVGCTQISAAQCTLFGGLYQGDGSTCAGGCPPTGTCCTGANCTITYSATCASADWIAGGSCTPTSRCAGACCDTSTGSCSIQTGASCAGGSLLFAGADTLCSTSPCPAPANDVCGDNLISYTIPGSGGMIAGQLVTALSEGNPASSCQSGTGQRDVFFYFTPDSQPCGWLFTLCGGATIDTTVSIHTACPTIGANNEIASACDDDGCGTSSGLSRLNLAAGVLSAGTQYIVRVALYSSGVASGAFTLTVGPGAPTNENCSTAASVTITSGIGTVTGDNACAAAALDPAAPAPTCGASPSRDLWYSFTTTPTQAGPWIINTCSASATDTVLAVYSGACASLTELVGGCNDDAGGGALCAAPRSEVAVTLAASTTYRVRVMAGAGSPSGGPFTLNILYAAVPSNDGCATPTVLTVPTTGTTTATGTNQFATLDGPSMTGSCSPNVSVDHDVWYSFSPTATNTYRFRTCGSALDTVLELFTGSCAALTSIACSDDFGGTCGTGSQFDVLLTPATYRLRVTSHSPGGSYTLAVSVTPPANDACSGATIVSQNSVTQGGLTAATIDAVPSCTSVLIPPTQSINATPQGVWFAVTPDADGTITADTLTAPASGTIIDSDIIVFSGACSSLACLIANDDIGLPAGTLRSKVVFPVTAGQTYLILVCADGSTTSTGTFALTLSHSPRPDNDSCSSPTILTGSSGSIAGTTLGATITDGAALTTSSGLFTTCSSSYGFFDVWYAHTPGCAGTIAFDTCGTFDTLISVHSACPTTTSANLIASNCNDNGPAGCTPGSRIAAFPATAGITYLIRVTGKLGYNPGAPFALTWTGPAGSAVAPTSATTSDNNFCAGSIANITLTAVGGSGSSIEWFADSCGGSPLGDTNPLTIPAPPATTTYYVRYATPGCPPSACAAITVSVTGSSGACCTGFGLAKACVILPAASCTGSSPSQVYRGDCTTCSPTSCCAADYNNSGPPLSVADIFAFLSDWFAQAPAADFNNSGPPPAVADIFAFLTRWFSGC